MPQQIKDEARQPVLMRDDEGLDRALCNPLIELDKLRMLKIQPAALIAQLLSGK